MKAFTILIFSVAALMVSACSQQPQVQTQAAASTAPLKIKGHTEVSIVLYHCEQDLGQIEMRYFPLHGVAVLVLDGVTHELQQERAASGFWYSNGLYTVRGKGEEIQLEIGRRAAIQCVTESF